MENNRPFLGIVLILIVVLSLPLESFAYEQKTHMGLTQATAQTYGSVYQRHLTVDEMASLVKGSSDEDEDNRPVNHFFDPVNERGLTVGISWIESKLWAQDTESQANFCIQRLCRNTVTYADKYFSSSQDYSWDRTVYEYAYGNKKRGLEGLGHILHLLQDSAVPAHVRNDQHLNNGTYGDFDPYELYTSRFTINNIEALLPPVSIPKRSDLSAYFDAVAGYTNGHFLSKDTLFVNYVYPTLQQLDIRNDGFAYDLFLKNRVVIISSTHNGFGKVTISKAQLTDPILDPESLVLKDYWSLLSKQAIRNGVGVIDLFFKAVEDEKRTHVLQKKNVSQQEIDAKEFAKKGFALAKKLYGSSLEESDLADLAGDQPAAVIDAVSNSEDQIKQDEVSAPEVVDSPPKVEPVTDPAIKPKTATAPTTLITSAKKSATTTTTTSPPNTPSRQVVPMRDINPSAGGGSGGSASGNSDSSQNISSTPLINIPTTPLFTNPAQDTTFATATVSFIGTSDPNIQIVLTMTDRLGATTTVSATSSPSGEWNILLTAQEGSSTARATAVDANNRSSLPALLSFTIDTTPPSVAGLSLLECEHSLTSDTCATVGVAHAMLSSTSTDIALYMYVIDGTIAATSTLLSSVTITSGTHAISLAVYDAMGNGATSTSVTIESLPLSLVINEIGWMGTPASVADTWIELYNTSSHPLDLTQIQLLSSDGQNTVPLSGTLAVGAYYLIEKSEAVSNVPPNLVAPTLTLSSTPTQLQLSYTAGGNVSILLDATPDTGACGSSWCAGVSGAGIRSMERIKTSVTGSIATNWNSNNGIIKNGNDSLGGILNATLKSRNSNTLNSVGYTCNTDISDLYVEGGYYMPTSGRCRYNALSGFGNGNYFGVVFAGTIGSSTSYDGHLLGALDGMESSDTVPLQYQAQGQDLFAVIYRTVFGPFTAVENEQFGNYFRNGSQPPPNNNYGVLRFKWGVAP